MTYSDALAVVQAQSPWALWTLQESGGSVLADVSGNDRHLHLSGAAPTLAVPGPHQSTGLKFPQAVSYARTTASQNSGVFTITCWFYFDLMEFPFSNSPVVLVGHEATDLSGSTDKNLMVIRPTSGTTTNVRWHIHSGAARHLSVEIPDAATGWYFVSASIGPAGQRLRLNKGTPTVAAAYTSGYTAKSQFSQLHTGTSFYSAAVPAAMAMVLPAVWTRQLSDSEIDAQYDAMVLPPPAPPEPPTLALAAVTQDSAVIEVQPPSGGETPTGYQYRVDGSAPVPVSDPDPLINLPGLTPATEYEVEARSVASTGLSVWSEPLALTTLDPPPPPEPPVVHCFSPVRGSAIRLTGLTDRGRVSDPVRWAVSRAVAKVQITEVVEQGGNEMLTTPEGHRRLRLSRHTQAIRHRADVQFLRVDPEVFSLVTGAPIAYNAQGVAVGFDAVPRRPLTSFALEVWSKLAGQRCEDGTQMWGYTLLPFLRGGRISGFAFANGRVSFNIIGAQMRRRGGWGVGPHDLDGVFSRLTDPVSGNTSYRMMMGPYPPPEQVDGVHEFVDYIDNGTPANPMPDPLALQFVDGGSPDDAGALIIDGGRP